MIPELNILDRDHMVHKAKIIYHLALYRKSLPTSTRERIWLSQSHYSAIFHKALSLMNFLGEVRYISSPAHLTLSTLPHCLQKNCSVSTGLSGWASRTTDQTTVIQQHTEETPGAAQDGVYYEERRATPPDCKALICKWYQRWTYPRLFQMAPMSLSWRPLGHLLVVQPLERPLQTSTILIRTLHVWSLVFLLLLFLLLWFDFIDFWGF